MMEQNRKKVIIIGAGPAGLTAGYELLKREPNMEVIIFEESNAIGGISKTVNHNGNRMDMGGHRFFSKSEEVNAWWKSFLPIQNAPSYDDIKLKRNVIYEKEGANPEKEEKVFLKRRRISRIYYQHKFFDYPISLKWATIRNMGFLTTLIAGMSYLKGLCCKKKESSLERFYENRFGRKLYRMFFEGYTEKLWGRHPREIAADWGAQRVKGLSIIAIIKDMWYKLPFNNQKQKKLETSLIEEFWYPKYGPGQLWETVAEQFTEMGGTIRKNCNVTNMISEKGKTKISGIVFRGETNTIQTETADIFLSSMPVKDLIAGIETAPGNVKAVAKNLPYRAFVTVGLLVEALSIKNETTYATMNQVVPDCWIYVQDTQVKLGRIQIFNNWSPYLVKDVEHTVWIALEYFCDEEDAFWNLSEADTIQLAKDELVKMHVIEEDTKILDAHREQIKKAYPAYFDSYAQFGEVITYLDTMENLYCIGRNGQHRYNNMDHSMLTSFAAVNNILGNGMDKHDIWDINVEKTYHETHPHTTDTKKASIFKLKI